MLIALAAAVAFAFGFVLQHRATQLATSARLRTLVTRPAWLAGIAADGIGSVLHAIALSGGRLAVVQPILASSLVFALPIAAALDRRRPSTREMLAAGAMTAGLIVFLALADPSGGHDDASAKAWLVAGSACGVAATLAALAARARARHRGVLLGVAAGVLLGLSAALLKATVERLDEGVLHVVADWHLYALVVVGYTATALTQASLKAGPLGAAIAAQLALDPLTSLLLGTLAFGERLHETAAGTLGALAGIGLMLTGIVALARASRGGASTAGRSRRRSPATRAAAATSSPTASS